MAEADIPAPGSSSKTLPGHDLSYEQQLALVESMMTCYDTPLTQAAGYTRDLLKTIIALQQPETSGIGPFDIVLKEPGECWPRTLRQHINAISRDNVMCSARDVWRILDALLPLVHREPKREISWLSMDTAPKDGTRIIVLHKTNIYKAYWGGVRFNYEDDGESRYPVEFGWTNGVYHLFNPECWLPYPDTTKIEGQSS